MKKLIIILSFLFPLIAESQILTVEQALATALQNNYSIRLQMNDSVMQAMQKGYARAALLPRLNATMGQAFSNNDQKQKFSNGNIRERNNIRAENLNAGIGLNWTLFDGLKMFIQKERLENNYTLSILQLHRQASTTIAAVIKTYYGISREKQALKAIQEQMSLHQERVRLAEGKLQSGLGSKPEWLQAKLDLNAQVAAHRSRETSLSQLKEDLNQLMAVEPGSEYDVIDSIPLEQSLEVKQIIAEAERMNPDLMVAGNQIKIAELNLKEVMADRYPIIGFNGNYNFIRNNNKAVVNDFTPLFNRNKGFNFGFTATIPLFNQYNVKRQIESAKINLDYQKLSRDLQAYQNRIAITKAYREYSVQKQILALEEENILLARENVYIAAERFRMGISNSLELREAQKSLEDAHNRLIAARYATKSAETDLLQISGALIKK